MSDGQPCEVLEAGRDYYVDAAGLYVFTSDYLRQRGECCGNKCRHCPYGWAKVDASRVGPGEGPTLSAPLPRTRGRGPG